MSSLLWLLARRACVYWCPSPPGVTMSLSPRLWLHVRLSLPTWCYRDLLLWGLASNIAWLGLLITTHSALRALASSDACASVQQMLAHRVMSYGLPAM